MIGFSTNSKAKKRQKISINDSISSDNLQNDEEDQNHIEIVRAIESGKVESLAPVEQCKALVIPLLDRRFVNKEKPLVVQKKYVLNEKSVNESKSVLQYINCLPLHLLT
jgi:hypothetical protein